MVRTCLLNGFPGLPVDRPDADGGYEHHAGEHEYDVRDDPTGDPFHVGEKEDRDARREHGCEPRDGGDDYPFARTGVGEPNAFVGPRESTGKT